MKIGELASRCQVTKDTIRYYVEKGLLIPFKKGAQMDFSEREKNDLLYIQRMKQMHFTVREMQEVLTLRRLSNLIEPDTIAAYERILKQKKTEIVTEISELKQAYRMVEQELREFRVGRENGGQPLGVPLRALELLCCPHCKKQLRVSGAQITGRYIESGELSCDCGYRAKISDGIVDTGNRYTGQYDSPDLTRGLYRDVGEEFVTGIQRCSDLVMDRLTEEVLDGRVVMETNINGYFFLYNHIRELEPRCLYIITDRYPEMLAMYKRLIETLGLELDLLFIADDSEFFPLQEGCVDLLLDFYGSNEQVLYKQNSFIQTYGKYLKEDALVLGALFGFERNSQSIKKVSSRYPECSSIALDAGAMIAACEKAGFLTSEQLVAVCHKTYDKYSFACHQEGEKLLQYYYEAKQPENGERSEWSQKRGGHSNFLQK